MAGRDWSQLPPTASKRLMRRAGQSARHGKNSLALVCSSWAEAVAAADALQDELDVDRCASTESLQIWLRKHGQQLGKLKLQCVIGMSVLPCPQLQHLVLRNCDLDFICSSAFSNNINAATALTSLHINKCRLIAESQGGVAEAAAAHLRSALSALTALQELSVCDVGAYYKHHWGGGASAELVLTTRILRPLQHLTQLHLQASDRWSPGLVQHIGSMTDLQDLRLGGTKYDAIQLTVTQLTTLTKLRRLGLRGIILDYGIANGFDYGTEEEAAANAAALLAWLPKLQELSSLQLRAVMGLEAEGDYIYPSSTAYRALTAGIALQHIDLRGTELSQGAWQCAFPLARKFPNITSLRCGGVSKESAMLHLSLAGGSCPNLQDLQLTAPQGYDDGWQPVQQLTGLTRLTVRNPSVSCARAIAQLTQLKRLGLLNDPLSELHKLQFMTDLLQQLTPLTQLSFLGVMGGMRRAFWEDAELLDSVAGAAQLGAEAAGCSWAFVNQAPPGSPPDVSAQLQTALDRAAKLKKDAESVSVHNAVGNSSSSSEP